MAANDYLAAIQLNAKYQLAWANLGNIYFDKGKMDSAIVCYDKAISLKNDLWETYGNRGAARASMKDYEGGLSDLNLAVKINPNYRMGISNRALVKEMVLDFPGAVEDYKRVIALDPKNVENHRYFNALGVAYQRLQKFQESLDEFTKAISLNPKGANATLGIYFLNRSYSYNALGNMDMARKDAQSALQYGATIDPTYRQTINLP